MAERERKTRERGEFFKLKGKAPRKAKRAACAAVFVMGMLTLPLNAFAAGDWDTATSQVRVGTLPLLAALAVGIAVAVGAVIAFLQMTAKGRNSNDSSSSEPESESDEQELFDDNGIQEWEEDDEAENRDTMRNSGYEDDPLTDYTIPITQILAYSGQAEAADENEPRLCGLGGEHAGNSYRIVNRRLTFGRDPAHCSILFPYESGEISRVHCTLGYIEESRLFILEDKGSSNGTFLENGDRLKPGTRYELQAGEKFSLSGNEQLFEVRIPTE